MSRKKTRIIIADADVNGMIPLLERRFACPVAQVNCAGELRAALEAEPPKDQPCLVFVGNRLPDGDPLELLSELKDTYPEQPLRLVLLSDLAEAGLLIGAINAGATEFMIKPVAEDDLSELVERLMKEITGADEVQPLQIVPTDTLLGAGSHPIIGRSPEMLEIYKLIGQVARSNATVLIEGESGTGKELIARAIHEYSDRRDCPFTAINCAALAETLLESELFGHEKGAFTGAESRRAGKFEHAHTGTIFLDEVGDMSLSTQAKVLRVLQEQTFERLGGNETIRVDVRVIAATNRSLVEAMQGKQFRVDLFYRLRGVRIHLPRLRDREGDLEILTSYFVDKYAREMGKKITGMTTSAFARLKAHTWLGNVRELENVIEAAVVRCDGEQVLEEHIRIEAEGVPSDNGSTLTPELLAAKIEEMPFDRLADGRSGLILDSFTSAIQRALIRKCLDHCNNNQVQAAKLLGISRNTLRAKLTALEL